MISDSIIQAFTALAHSPDPDLPEAALMMARVAYPNLDAGMYLERLDAAPVRADIVVDGGPRSVVAQVSKQGVVFVFDRNVGPARVAHRRERACC